MGAPEDGPARALAAAGVLVAALLLATAVPGVFTVDESAYLNTLVAARAGGFAVPGTEALPPSLELLWFEPLRASREVATSPAYPLTPPLWALVALPFSLLGLRGLVLMNVLAWLATGVLLWVLAGRVGARGAARALAPVAFGFGAYSLDYAQAIWPHVLTAALFLGAFALATEEDPSPGALAGAGILAGVAAGMRYLGLVSAAGLLAAVALLAPAGTRRGRVSALAAGLALPLLLTASINYVRLGIFHPATKGKGYVTRHAVTSRRGLADAPRLVYTRLIDQSLRPPLPASDRASNPWRRYVPATGVLVVDRAYKKAWTQSAPWVPLALIGLLAAWIPRRPRVMALRAAGIVVAFQLGVLAWFGFSRHEGLCYNQRYLFEVLPLAALALAGACRSRLVAPPIWYLRGTLAGCVAGLVLLLLPEGGARQVLFMKLPVALGVGILVAWARRLAGVLEAGLAAAVALAAFLHLGDDVLNSRFRRVFNLRRARVLAEVLPLRAGVVLHGGLGDWVGSLLLERDLLVADTWADRGRTAPEVIRAFARSGRRVFVLPVGMPLEIRDRLATAGTLRPVSLASAPEGVELLEFEIRGNHEDAP